VAPLLSTFLLGIGVLISYGCHLSFTTALPFYFNNPLKLIFNLLCEMGLLHLKTWKDDIELSLIFSKGIYCFCFRKTHKGLIFILPLHISSILSDM